MNKIQKELFAMQDKEYKAFHSRLMPTVDSDTVIGIRTPILRGYAKKINNSEQAKRFLVSLPHMYYEENNLHAFLIEQIRDYDECISEINRFLPYVDNWATCDMMRPKCFKKNTDALLHQIEKWLDAPHSYTVRFGIETLMLFYLDEHFEERFLERVCRVESDEYYVNMMRAWYFATALAKQYDSAVKYIAEGRLDKWTHNKTIRKAIESYRITAEKKEFLRTLNVKI
ncbi:MAG: DNA alkylation repair protein [Clostridia bacterium]|nr:DNA alkylation repair protein [Clostridia bacterium]